MRLYADDEGSMFKCYQRVHGRAWIITRWLSYHKRKKKYEKKRFLLGFLSKILVQVCSSAHQHTHFYRKFLCRTTTRVHFWFSQLKWWKNFSKNCFSFIAFAISALFDWNLSTAATSSCKCSLLTLKFSEFQFFLVSRVCHIYKKSKCDSRLLCMCDSYHD